RCWFAIDIAIRYRYRSCPAFPIASSDIDSDPEKTTTPVAARRALCGDNIFVSGRTVHPLPQREYTPEGMENMVSGR
ncbi:MAG: hypothetical protein BECKG1743E_GA0114224_109543, partial [Candidatus Kentron sp. G]